MAWEAQFIGREDELKLLQHALELAKAGHGGVIFITGEAGVGKTRLAEELEKAEMGFEFEFLKGQCIYSEGVDPYLPFIDLFKGYLTAHPYVTTAVMATFASPASIIFDYFPTETEKYSPKIEKKSVKTKGTSKKKETKKSQSENDNISSNSGMYKNSLNSNTLEPSKGLKPTEFSDFQLLEGKHRMFETISKIIINISQKKTLVLFLDDLHWADAASLHLFHYLARNITKQPILMIGAYRSEELENLSGQVHPLQELITRLGSESLYSLIGLERLGHEQSSEIIISLLGVKNIPPDFANLIFVETEGNPFFIREVLRTLVEEGALSIKNDKLVLNISPEEIVIPTSIKELIKLQIQRLDDSTVEVLEHSSVIGNEFDLELLKNIVDYTPKKIINTISKLIDAKILHNLDEKGGFVWRFSHNKTREVIYSELNDNKKRLIHLAIANYLEKYRAEKISEVVYDLANHYYHGFDFKSALAYSIVGGEKAMRAYANKEALELFNISLNSIRRLDEKVAETKEYKHKKTDVLSKLGALHITLGEWDKALDYYEQIIPICDEMKDNKRKAKAYLDIGWLYQRRSFWEEAQKNFRKSLALADAIKEESIVTQAYNGLGAVLEREGDFDQAIECYTISRKFAEKNDDLLNLAKAHNAFGRIYNQQRNYLKAIDHKNKSIYLFEQVKDLPELAKSYTSLGLTYLDMGNMEKNIEYNEKCILLADEISDIRIKGYGLSNAVEALVKTNQLDKALNYASDALEIFKKLGERFMIALNYMNYGTIFKHMKDWEKSKYYFKTTIEFMENLKIPYHLADCYRQFADMYRKKGEAAKTVYYLQKAKDIYQSISAANYVKQVEEEIKIIQAK
jgi:predicted ATPase